MSRRDTQATPAPASASIVVDPRTQRVRTRLRVYHGVDGPDCADYAENISEGGLFINTNQVHPVGTVLAMELEFPTRSVAIAGEVVWAIRVPEHQRAALVCGMGIQFRNAPPQWYAFFRSWRRGLTRNR